VVSVRGSESEGALYGTYTIAIGEDTKHTVHADEAGQLVRGVSAFIEICGVVAHGFVLKFHKEPLQSVGCGRLVVSPYFGRVSHNVKQKPSDVRSVGG
jgi:hypothetical protein